MRILLIFMCALCSLNPTFATEKTDNSAKSITKNGNKIDEVYKRAFRIKHFKPRYPRLLGRKGNAGVVEIEFMIGLDGKAFEPLVIISSDPLFEKNALKSIKQNTYTPAQLNGNSVESVHTAKISFSPYVNLEGASEKFAIDYKLARKALNSETATKGEIKTLIEKLKKHFRLTEYSLNHINVVEYLYAKRFLESSDQINALVRLNLYENYGRNFLDSKTERNINKELLNLYINNADYSKAERPLKYLLQQEGENSNTFKTIEKEILSIKNSKKPFEGKMVVNKRGFALRTLLRQGFAFFDLKGEIESLQLRCKRKFAKLEFVEGQSYQIPKSWGECNVNVSGKPNSHFILVQQ